jgi:Ion transport protein
LDFANYIFVAIFALEMMIKVVASGLILGSNTYLRTGWNVIDGFLVITSVVDLVVMSRVALSSHTEPDTTSRILAMLRVFRLLRALRPLTGSNDRVLLFRLIFLAPRFSYQSSTRPQACCSSFTPVNEIDLSSRYDLLHILYHIWDSRCSGKESDTQLDIKVTNELRFNFFNDNVTTGLSPYQSDLIVIWSIMEI